MNITEFIEARITEDEKTAGTYIEVLPAGDMAPLSRRVLAECAAKRVILVLAQKASETEQAYDDYEWQGTVESAEPLTGDAILYALAAVYKDHPDYQEEWTS